MERFILRSNIVRYEERLAQVKTDRERAYFQGRLTEWRRQLALLDAERSGAYDFETPAGRSAAAGDRQAKFHEILEKEETPSLLLHPGSGLRIVDMNQAYASVTMIDPSKVNGKMLFEVFPDNPDDPDADGVANLYASLRIVTETGKPHSMAIQRYDIANANGGFEVRYWQPVNTPILDDSGRLVYLLHQVEDVTSKVNSALPKGEQEGHLPA